MCPSVKAVVKIRLNLPQSIKVLQEWTSSRLDFSFSLSALAKLCQYQPASDNRGSTRCPRWSSTQGGFMGVARLSSSAVTLPCLTVKRAMPAGIWGSKVCTGRLHTRVTSSMTSLGWWRSKTAQRWRLTLAPSLTGTWMGSGWSNLKAAIATSFLGFCGARREMIFVQQMSRNGRLLRWTPVSVLSTSPTFLKRHASVSNAITDPQQQQQQLSRPLLQRQRPHPKKTIPVVLAPHHSGSFFWQVLPAQDRWLFFGRSAKVEARQLEGEAGSQISRCYIVATVDGYIHPPGLPIHQL